MKTEKEKTHGAKTENYKFEIEIGMILVVIFLCVLFFVGDPSLKEALVEFLSCP
jgi:hypothetical protein